MTTFASHMPARTVIAATLGFALAGPAFAQSSQGGNVSSGNSNSQPPAAQHAPGQGQSTGQSQDQHQGQPMTRDQLRQQLSQAGFRDVKILDTSYLIHARTQDGNPVIMVVNPPNAGPQTAAASGNAQTASSSGSSTGANPQASSGGGKQAGSSQNR